MLLWCKHHISQLLTKWLTQPVKDCCHVPTKWYFYCGSLEFDCTENKGVIFLTKLQTNLCFGGYTSEKLLKKHNVRDDWFQQPETFSKLQFPLTLRCSCRRFQYHQYLLLSQLLSLMQRHGMDSLGHPSCRVPEAQEMSSSTNPPFHLFALSSSARIRVSVANFGPRNELDVEGIKSLWVTLSDFIRIACLCVCVGGDASGELQPAWHLHSLDEVSDICLGWIVIRKPSDQSAASVPQKWGKKNHFFPPPRLTATPSFPQSVSVSRRL